MDDFHKYMDDVRINQSGGSNLSNTLPVSWPINQKPEKLFSEIQMLKQSIKELQTKNDKLEKVILGLGTLIVDKNKN